MNLTKKQLRTQFREAVIARDGNKCVICGKSGSDVKLDAHHIVDRNLLPAGGYVVSNGISLCDTENGCHMKAEEYHITEGTCWEVGYHPSDLYAKIGSSREKAFDDSVALKRKLATP